MRLSVIALAALLAAPAFAQEGSESGLDMNDVPAAARAAAIAVAGTDEFTNVGLDLDGGQATYEFSYETDAGMTNEVDVTGEGMLDEHEQEIALDDVPESVMTLVDKYLADFEPEFIELSTRGDLQVFYELEGEYEGNTIDVEVNQAGTAMTVADDSAI